MTAAGWDDYNRDRLGCLRDALRTGIGKEGFVFDIMSTTFFLSRRSLKASATSGMPTWQDKIFILLARNADDASSYFRIPTNRVVEIGTQVTV